MLPAPKQPTGAAGDKGTGLKALQTGYHAASLDPESACRTKRRADVALLVCERQLEAGLRVPALGRAGQCQGAPR